MPTRRRRAKEPTVAYERGYDIGWALGVVFGPASTDDLMSVTQVGKFFASASGFTVMEPAFEFIAGFTDALRDAGPEPAKQIGAGGGDYADAG